MISNRKILILSSTLFGLNFLVLLLGLIVLLLRSMQDKQVGLHFAADCLISVDILFLATCSFFLFLCLYFLSLRRLMHSILCLLIAEEIIVILMLLLSTGDYLVWLVGLFCDG